MIESANRTRNYSPVRPDAVPVIKGAGSTSAKMKVILLLPRLTLLMDSDPLMPNAHACVRSIEISLICYDF